MASPAKDMKTGSYSHSFELPAKNYNNSPIEKNYGSVESRFPASAVPYSSNMGGVGSSPAKGWFKNLTKKLNPINAIKKLTGKKTGLIGKLNEKLGIGGGEVQPHGDEMHTGGTAAAGGVGEAVAGAGAGMPPDKTNQAAAAMAAGGAAEAAGGQAAGGSKWDMLRAQKDAMSGAEEEVV